MKKILTVAAYLTMLCAVIAFLVWLEYIYSSTVAPLRKLPGQHSVVQIQSGQQDGTAYQWSGIDKGRQELSKLRAEAAQGDREKQYDLAMRYVAGDGVARNEKQAIKWLEKAARMGHVQSQYALGVVYQEGEPGEKSLPQAVKWFSQAARNGSAAASYALGQMYYEGHAVAQNSIVAYSLVRMAGKDTQLDTAAGQALQQIAAQMTPAQIDEANRLVRKTGSPQKLMIAIDAAQKKPGAH